MFTIEVSGWFQCRLATDPDPSDEPRGVSGWTFAVPGEPDLDRTIRTCPNGTVPRSHANLIGVTVKRVAIDGLETAEHPLLGAYFELLEDPVFEGRNGLASEDTEEPIYPFCFRIKNAGIEIIGRHRDLGTGEWIFAKAEGIVPASSAATKATGTEDSLTFWQDRKTALEAEIATATNSVQKEACQWRLLSDQDIDDIKVLGQPASKTMLSIRRDAAWISGDRRQMP